MNHGDGMELRRDDVPGVMERVEYRSGQVTVARFLRTDGGWRCHHELTIGASAVKTALAWLSERYAKSGGFTGDIAEERIRQGLRWPVEEGTLPDGTGGAGRPTYEEISRNACDRAAREGRLTHAHILEEEAAEVLNATDPDKLRAELVQLAAVCCRWVEDLDRRRRP